MIYQYQRPTYEKLRRTVAAYRRARECKLGVKPRFHRLIIGPSGSGKTFLAGQVGRELNWEVMEVNTSAWIVLGAAKETPTWHGILRWLCDTKGLPKILVLDEIDKIQGTDSWSRYLRTELFDLLDGKVTMQTPEEDYSIKDAQESLKECLIFGCGAFQEAFDAKPTLGFNSTDGKPAQSNDIAKYLAREVVNRFDSELLILPDLKKEDYQRMIDDIRDIIPAAAYDVIEAIGEEHIEQAIINKTSSRFVENLVAQAFYKLAATDCVYKHTPPEPVVQEIEQWEADAIEDMESSEDLQVEK